MALHAELSVCATYWAEDGAEGIEGAEPLSNGDEDDAGEEWQGE
jgi:hypothetical protein